MAAAKIKRPPRAAEVEGVDCVLVEVATGETVTMDAADWQRLLDAGFSGNLSANRDGKCGLPCVKAQHPEQRRVISVARWLAKGTTKQQVRYRDGDRLNLRRANLELVERRGKRLGVERPVYVPEDAKATRREAAQVQSPAAPLSGPSQHAASPAAPSRSAA